MSNFLENSANVMSGRVEWLMMVLVPVLPVEMMYACGGVCCELWKTQASVLTLFSSSALNRTLHQFMKKSVGNNMWVGD